jgi:hypothetical protein
MPLDADVAEFLANLEALHAPALSDGTPEMARVSYDAAPKPPPDPVVRVGEA